MKKSHLNIFMFALSMGLVVPSYLEAANEVSATAEQHQQAPFTTAPAAEQPAVPDATHPVEGQHAPGQTVTEKIGDATEPSKDALAEGAEKSKKAVTGKKSKKKGKKGKRKKSHGKQSSHVCQPPADVLSKLDARNNTKEADAVCNTPAAACETPAPSCATTSEVPMTSGESGEEASEK